ncbi:hypothetical protein SAMN06265221_11172 [Paracoccus laeviglucosivorans]|uniref:Uncharacterized protein n=1 Tax=Paracoccus laeviglucosivorans TaxID=1197861 RepID=A0A521E5P9_9RHOB|nr:hypothetical protein SAMN06265221_11172 [Paracoccus laeviglucosivorans]
MLDDMNVRNIPVKHFIPDLGLSFHTRGMNIPG